MRYAFGMREQSFTATVRQHPENASTFVEVPFDPKAVFGKVRAPVLVTINGFTFATTIARMGGVTFIGLNRANREGAGVGAGDVVEVDVALDESERTVAVPEDFAAALAADPAAGAAWKRLSYTHRREYVQAIEEAKRPETRARRIEGALRALASR